MALYLCKLGAPDGTIVHKELESPGEEALRQNLEEQGFYVFELRKQRLGLLATRGSSRRKIDTKALLTFNQELLVLIKSGMPILQALDTILEKGDKGRFNEMLASLREEIKGGASLSEAFERYPGAFPPLYVASIRAGERTGDLPHTIRRFIQFVKRAEGFKKKVLSALFYPAFLIGAVTLAVTLLLVYVVPTFSQIYAESGSQLPVPTQMLIAFTGALQHAFPFMLVGGGLGIYGLRRYGRTPVGRVQLDSLKLRIPFVGDLLGKYSVTSFTRTLATVLASGIPVVESLKMTVGTLNNRVLERRLNEATRKVEEGMALSPALESVRLMPALALRMIAVGETTGALEEMLVDISEYFEEEIDHQLNLLTTAIEPIIMIVMGVVIGGIIVTMYLPIFKIAGAMG